MYYPHHHYVRNGEIETDRLYGTHTFGQCLIETLALWLEEFDLHNMFVSITKDDEVIAVIRQGSNRNVALINIGENQYIGHCQYFMKDGQFDCSRVRIMDENYATQYYCVRNIDGQYTTEMGREFLNNLEESN